MRRFEAAALTFLLTLSAWLVASLLFWGLDELGLKTPRIVSGGGVAAGAAALVIVIFFSIVCLVAAVVAMIVAAARENNDPGHPWKHAATAAAGAFTLPALALFFDGPNANALLTVLVPALGLAAASRVTPKRPFLTALAVPGLALLFPVVVAMGEGFGDLSAKHRAAQVERMRKAAEARDDAELKRALDALPSQSRADFEPTLMDLADHDRPEQLKVILRHPNVPVTHCSRALKAALENDLAEWRHTGSIEAFYCAKPAAAVAARHASDTLTREAAARLDTIDDRVKVLVTLGDSPAALRWMSLADLGDGGVLRPNAYTWDFLAYAWEQGDGGFWWQHVELQSLLIKFSASGNARRVVETLEHGARPNVPAPCGATALTAAATGNFLMVETISALLDAGADPNLPGAAMCSEETFDGGVATPLEHLVPRHQNEAIWLLVTYGADAGNLAKLAENDPYTLDALRGVRPFTE